jgi:hypothetical protein
MKQFYEVSDMHYYDMDEDFCYENHDVETVEQLNAEAADREQEYLIEAQDQIEARGPEFKKFGKYDDEFEIPF